MDHSPPDAPLYGISQRLPPQNQQAEVALLGALLFNNRAFDRVADFLEARHFADPVNGAIFQRISERILAGQIADAVTLAADFGGSGTLDPVGGVAYLAQLLSAMIGIINVGEYGRAVHDAWIRRQMIDIGETLVNEAFGAEPGATVASIAAAAQGALDAVAVGASPLGKSFSTALMGAWTRSEAAWKGEKGAAPLDTGVKPMDDIWQGLFPGQLYYLMAPSGTGKTAAIAQIVRNVARRLLADGGDSGEKPGHVHFFSLEMTAEDLGVINLASSTRWTADQIQRGQIGDIGAWDEFDTARRGLERLPIFIDDDGTSTIGAIKTRARAVHRSHRTRLIVVDYMELIRRDAAQARMGLPEWVPTLGYELKALAKMLKVPIIVLRQVNKAQMSGEETRRPVRSDLPYTAGQEADAVFALYRPELGMPNDPPAPAMRATAEKQAQIDADWRKRREDVRGLVEFGSLKRRFGPSDQWRRLRFDGPRMLLHKEDAGGLFNDGGF